ncbi:MAG TPA: hypothetical protein VE397_16010 [Stellaceae bacterium]|jgi:uncharacterized lipoprotein YajG|nr:hypothetical protein [Stellaceae bacterium]
MGRMLLVLAATGLLAACAGMHHATVSAPPPGISYRVEGDDIGPANQRAESYCQQYGKHAKLQTIDRSGDAKLAVYACT